MMPDEEIKKLISQSREPHHVLVVEDHVAYATYLKEIICAMGFSCDVAYSPRSALALDVVQFTTAIIDWNFPGQMSGINCGICMRDRNPDIRIVIHTGFTDVTIAEKCKSLGFDIIPKRG